MRRTLATVVSALSLLAIAACSAVPGAGPTSGAIVAGATAVSVTNGSGGVLRQLPYALVDINSATVELLSVPTTFQGAFRSSRSVPGIVIGRGDKIDITIFESRAGGLFIPAGSSMAQGNFVRLPSQEVAGDGTISVPYVGAVRVAGRTPASIETEIENLLVNRALEPQVVVAVSNRASNLVTVTGAVGRPGRIAINPNGTRVLDAIAEAGGASHFDFETIVTLQRGDRQATMRLSDLVEDPSGNIVLLPGDTVTLQRDQRYFSILGATSSQNRRVPFDNLTVSLAEGIALGGGLSDDLADPMSVFVFRQESRETLRDLGVDTTPFPSAMVPTAYELNMRSGDGLLLAQMFQLRSGDIIYLSTHPTADFLKLNTLVSSVLGTANSAKTLRE